MSEQSIPEKVPVLHTRFRIVTPMFINGIYPQKAELRLPSVKGCLRFWFRAIHPGYFLQTDKRKKAPTLEEAIFGSAQHGQSRFLMHLSKHSLRHVPYTVTNHKRSFFVVRGVPKHYFPPGQSFSLSFAFRPTEVSWMKQVYQAVLASTWLLGNIGGLGTRTRRGYGALLLEDWQPYDAEGYPPISEWLSSLPQLHQVSTIDEWIQQIRQGLQTIRSWFLAPERPVQHVSQRFPNTRLSQRARLYYRPQEFDSEEAARQEGERVLHAFANEASERFHRLVLGLPMYLQGTQYHAAPPEEFKSKHAKHAKHVKRMASPIWLRIIPIQQTYTPIFLLPQTSLPAVKGLPDHSLQQSYQLLQEHLKELGYEEVWLS
ncbi:type III-B CRISPR module RAMP protein Cmr1 [Thermoflavimicrobium dichotomicum]|uniref:CRISPR type III-B/RAMP module RAMP protein Cmr1 n=1 Tax=Thermoflavimicrobium dichotomicum TaxID=46223 RepID=A0A1I3UQI2_9BACL|nr:type III-B CRISPR module RAMP protein Cmr1 [Thermoflavimicrobium dichotomicum]SFJ85588.1 CRISPR type III-B/RAMP module RAMP protein Cmr1 [Thermoflavimicrobium dichotomicum]